MQTTALHIPAGAAQIVSTTLATIVLRRFPVSVLNIHHYWLKRFTAREKSLTCICRAECEMLDSHCILRPFGISRCVAHESTMEQPNRAPLRLLFDVFWGSTIMGHDCRLGHSHIFRAHQGNPFPLPPSISFSSMKCIDLIILPKFTHLTPITRNSLLMRFSSSGILLARLCVLCSGELSTNPEITYPIASAL